MVWNNRLFPALAKAAKFRIPIEGDLFLRQCASQRNIFHLPASYHYPTGSITGYFTRLNWNEDVILLEKERKESFEYFIIDRKKEIVHGPFSRESYSEYCRLNQIEMDLKELSELDWIINY